MHAVLARLGLALVATCACLAAPRPSPAFGQAANEAITAHERRIALEEALIWSGDLNEEAGRVSVREFNQALAAWRTRTGRTATGPVTDDERTALTEAAERQREAAGFTLVDDEATGVRIRLPLALTPLDSKKGQRYGTEWSSPDRSIVITTHLVKQGRHSINSWQRFWIDRLAPKIGYQHALNDSLVLEGEYDSRPRKDAPGAGGRRHFHLRANILRGDLIGMMVDYAPERADIMERLVNMMASRFQNDNGWREVLLHQCGGEAALKASGAVRVIFATNRTPQRREQTLAERVALGTLYEARQDNRLNLGCIDVSVPGEPKDRAAVSVGSATYDSARDYFAARYEHLIASSEGDPGNLISLVDDPGRQAKRAIVFVHGYNVSFAHAVARVAQIAKDTSYQGNVFLFSWPSLGRLRAYGADLDQAEQSEPYLESFLRMILNNPSIERLDVVAHSMGSQPTLRVLRLYSRLFEVRGIRDGNRRRGWGQLGQVIFAAPDVGRDLFREQVKSIVPVAEQITLYGSKSDCAMLGSSWWRYDVRRAGDTSQGALVVDGVDTIEAPGTFTSGFVDGLRNLSWEQVANRLGIACNHSYFADRPSVLDDIRRLLEGGSSEQLRPGKRAPDALVPEPNNGRPYWRLKAR